MSWKLQGGVEHWSSVDNIVLLEMLAGDLEVEDEDEIDWARLLENWERWVWSEWGGVTGFYFGT